MRVVNMLEAKNSLSKLVDAVESGAESEIVIARNGRPAARLVPLENPASGPRLGVARGRFEVPDSIDDFALPEIFFERAGAIVYGSEDLRRSRFGTDVYVRDTAS